MIQLKLFRYGNSLLLIGSKLKNNVDTNNYILFHRSRIKYVRIFVLILYS